jgi:flagellar hook assembly protein FlgD
VNTLTSRAASAGDVSLFWNGKDSGGKSVASGNYLVQIRASTADGESVRVIYPFAIVR